MLDQTLATSSNFAAIVFWDAHDFRSTAFKQYDCYCDAEPEAVPDNASSSVDRGLAPWFRSFTSSVVMLL